MERPASVRSQPGQRDRIIAAMVAVVAERGYADVTIANVVKRARVSRSTFYEHFSDKEDCFLAAYRELVGTLRERVVTAYEGQPEDDWAGRVTAGLAALLHLLATNPDAARVAIVELVGAGSRAQELALNQALGLVPLVEPGVSLVKGEIPPRVPRAVVGGAAMLIVEQINAGGTEQLPALLPEVLYVILVPFLGPVGARAKMLEAQRAPPALAVEQDREPAA